MSNAHRFVRHLTDDPRCFICDAHEETVDHILRQCPAATSVWRKFPGMHDYDLFRMNFDTWIMQNIKDDFTRDGDWPIVFVTTLWWLWKWRNCRCFDKDVTIPVDQVGFIMGKVGLIKRAMEREGSIFGFSRHPRIEVYVRWEFPRENWVRLNTDGASKGNPGAAGAGAIIRGHRGELFEMVAINCGFCSSTRAEILVVLHGLNVAWKAGHRRVQLTLDSELVVRVLSEDNTTSSQNSHIIRRCKNFLRRQDWQVTIHHCYREANRAADWLANFGVDRTEKFTMVGAAPAGLRAILVEDVGGVSLARSIPAVAA